MAEDPLAYGLASLVGSAGQAFAQKRQIGDERARQDILMQRQRQNQLQDVQSQRNFQMKERGTDRANKMEDAALQTWLGLADKYGYTTAKTPEDRQKIASATDQAFSSIPVYGKLLPMVKQRMEIEAQKKKISLAQPQGNALPRTGIPGMGSALNYLADQTGATDQRQRLSNIQKILPLTPYARQQGQAQGKPEFQDMPAFLDPNQTNPFDVTTIPDQDLSEFVPGSTKLRIGMNPKYWKQ